MRYLEVTARRNDGQVVDGRGVVERKVRLDLRSLIQSTGEARFQGRDNGVDHDGRSTGALQLGYDSSESIAKTGNARSSYVNGG